MIIHTIITYNSNNNILSKDQYYSFTKCMTNDSHLYNYNLTIIIRNNGRKYFS